MYLSPKPQGSTTILVKVIKLPRSLGTFAIFSAYCAMKYAGKGRRRRQAARASNPYRKSREMAVIIAWLNPGLNSATLSQISSNIMALFSHRAQCSMQCTLKLTPFWHCNCPLGNARYIYTYQQHIEDYKVFKLVKFPSYLSLCHYFTKEKVCKLSRFIFYVGQMT